MTRYARDEVAPTLNALTGLFSYMDDKKQANTLLRYEEEDRAKKAQSESNVGANYNLLKSNIGTLTGTPQEQVTGKLLYGQDLQTDQAIKETKEKTDRHTRLGQIVSFFQENPGVSIESLPPELSKDYVGLQAISDYTKITADTEEGKARKMAAVQKVADIKYPLFAAKRDLAQKAAVEGDIGTLVNVARQLVKEAPTPYSLGEFDQGSHTFELKYLDSPSGEDKRVGRISLKEVMSKMNKMNKEIFVNSIAMNSSNTDLGNRKAIENPIPIKDSSGNDFLAITKKQLADPTRVDITLINQKTGESSHINGWEVLYKLGFTKTNLDDEKKQADIEGVNLRNTVTKKQLFSLEQGEEVEKALSEISAMEGRGDSQALLRKYSLPVQRKVRSILSEEAKKPVSVDDSSKIFQRVYEDILTSSGLTLDEITGLLIDQNNAPVTQSEKAGYLNTAKRITTEAANIVQKENVNQFEAEKRAVVKIKEENNQMADRGFQLIMDNYDPAKEIEDQPDIMAFFDQLNSEYPEVAVIIEKKLAKVKVDQPDEPKPTPFKLKRTGEVDKELSERVSKPFPGKTKTKTKTWGKDKPTSLKEALLPKIRGFNE
ncbi:MAG: hypothetical protein H8E41_10065 [Desulfobulbaceae bacterium]|uniref:Uncharacterized protein n=1 Tax=Candidatus Desulfobia pelagia TaxID=2841692 RepID=A0A8J6NDY3_9BACT|nr:hypothetical protein [Candidatus Desulfobia pelagia]